MDLDNLLFCKFMSSVITPDMLRKFRRSLTRPTATIPIIGIIQSGPRTQMLRVIARWVVARMEDVQVVWNRPDEKAISQAMRRLFRFVSGNVDATIRHSFMSGERPFEALIGRSVSLHGVDQKLVFTVLLPERQILRPSILILHRSALQALGAGRTAVYAVGGLFHCTAKRVTRAQFVKMLPAGQLVAA